MQEIDASFQRCPIPVLKAQKALRDMATGDRLRLLATDGMAPVDLAHFCNQNGHHLIDQSEEDGLFTFVIEKGPAQPTEMDAAPRPENR